ncbi:MAG TPA: 50S ribosome-binding protein YggL [Gemmatimonadaceae bacterium]|nr:50S ribosome-binding protein YggL [Gemmatimonadaceae bacterium]
MSAPCPEFGFAVTIEPPGGPGPRERPTFDEALAALLASRGLSVEAGRAGMRRFIVRSEASQATDADREAVRAWLAARPDVRDARVSDLIDLREAAG